jgi:hypothetical protein
MSQLAWRCTMRAGEDEDHALRFERFLKSGRDVRSRNGTLTDWNSARFRCRHGLSRQILTRRQSAQA